MRPSEPRSLDSATLADFPITNPDKPARITSGLPTIWAPGQSRRIESILCPKCSKDQCHDKECRDGRSGDKQYRRWLI